MMNKNLSLCLNGMIGGLTFGMWHYYITLHQIEEHNKKMRKAMERDKEQFDKYKLYIV